MLSGKMKSRRPGFNLSRYVSIKTSSPVSDHSCTEISTKYHEKTAMAHRTRPGHENEHSIAKSQSGTRHVRLETRISRGRRQPLTRQRSNQQSLATMQAIPHTPKRRRAKHEDGTIKRKRKCDEPFQLPLLNFLAEPATPKKPPATSIPTTPQLYFLLSPVKGTQCRVPENASRY